MNTPALLTTGAPSASRRRPYRILGHCWQHATVNEPLRGAVALVAGIWPGGAP